MVGNLGDLVFAALFPVLFVAFWSAISYLLAVFGGWRQLADNYRAAGGIAGRQWWFQSAHLGRHVGAARYGSVLFVTAGAEGVQLSVLLPFRIGHPTLLIPWKDIQVERGAGWFGYKFVVPHLAKTPQVPIVVSSRLADQIRDAAGLAWPEHGQPEAS
jgi:hypothetical protein